MSYGDFAEWVNFAYWWSFSGEGLRSTGLTKDQSLNVCRTAPATPGLSNTTGLFTDVSESICLLWSRICQPDLQFHTYSGAEARETEKLHF